MTYREEPTVTLLENGGIVLTYFKVTLKWTPAEVEELKKKGHFKARKLKKSVVSYAEHVKLIPLTPLYL